MSSEKREVYREGVIVDVEKTSKGYAIGVKDGYVVEYFYSEKPMDIGRRVRVYCVYGKAYSKSRFEFEFLD